MMRNRKLNRNGYVLVFIIVFLITYGLFTLFTNKDNMSDANDPSITIDPTVTTTPTAEVIKKDYSLKEQSYRLYKDDALNFGFIVVEYLVNTKIDLDIDFNLLKTSEGVNLSDISRYEKKLEENNFYLSKLNVFNENYKIQKGDQETIVMFIPFNNLDLKELKLNILDIDFIYDLDVEISPISDLYFKGDDDIIVSDDVSFKVSNTLNISGDTMHRIYDDGFKEEVMFSSNTEVHAFKIHATTNNGKIFKIEDAFYETTNKNKFQAFSKEFHPMKYENIMGSKIVGQSEGILIFTTNNPTREPITYDGVLYIKLEGKEDYIKVVVNL